MRTILTKNQNIKTKRLLLRTTVFAFAFAFANLFLVNKASAQFPVVAGTSTSFAGNNLTTQTVSLPSGVQVGDLLIVIMGFRDRTFTTTTVSFPSGWTELVTRTSGTSQGVVYYKVATATEAGAASISVAASPTGGTGARCAHVVYRIQKNTYTGTPEAAYINATSMLTSGINPNPPSLTPSWGSAKNLWIAGAAGTRAATDPNTTTFVPASFSDGIYSFDSDNTGSSSGSVSTATRQFEGTTLDPAAFALSTGIYRAFTIAIKGAIVCPTITATANYSNVLCNGTPTGQIIVSGSGGSSPYTFSIDNGGHYNSTVIAGASYVSIDANSGKFINLPVGSYQIRVRDNNGCVSNSVQ